MPDSGGKTPRPYVRVDIFLQDDPAIVATEPWGALIMVYLLCWSKQTRSRGHLPTFAQRPEWLMKRLGVTARDTYNGTDMEGVIGAALAGLRSARVLGDCHEDAACWYISAWETWQSDPSTPAERTRKHRETKRSATPVSRLKRAVTKERDMKRSVTLSESESESDTESESITKPPRGKRAATRQQPNGHTMIIDRYRAAFVAVYSAEPMLTGGDRSQIGRMLRDRPPDRCAACWPACVAETIAAFVADPDPWLMEHRHPLRHLPGRANLYLRAVDWHAPDCRASAPALALVES